jgi:signal transduction histidine kinase/CheY-like chemotaxis protein/HAMP domain-containing protein
VLARRLARSFVLLAATLLLVAGAVLTLVSYNAQFEQVVIRQQKTAGEAALVTNGYLTQAQNVLSARGQVGSVQGLLLRSLEVQQEQLREIIYENPGMLHELTLVDHEGQELAKVSRFHTFLPQELGSQATSPAFQQAIQGQFYVADQAHISPYSSVPAVSMAVPVEGRDRPGVLLADVSIKGLWDAVAQVEVGETGYAYLIDRTSGELVGHSELARYLSLQGQSLADIPLVEQAMAGVQGSWARYRGLAEEPVIGAISELPDSNWSIIVELPTAEALAGVRRMLYLLGISIVVGVAIAAGLGVIVPRRVVQPLLSLQQGAREIGSGHLDYVIDIQTGDEIEDLAEAFNQMAASLKASTEDLERWGYELETRVEERTQELAEATDRVRRRAVQLQISSDVARAITSVRDLERLLPEITDLISRQFDWYHVGIFLLDELEEYAVLHAANSEGGQRMLANNHHLQVGQTGIVGSVTATGEPRIALDVGEDAVYFDNPELPETRSEMALPLKVGDRIIGALDIQSREPAAYDAEDVALLSTLADQIAIAIENARLFARTEAALEEVRGLHRRYVQQEWSTVIAEQQELTYEYRRSGAPSLGDALPEELGAALREGQVVALEKDGDNGAGREDVRAALAAPIKLRDQVIGALDLHEIDEPRRWTEDEIALVQTVADQVGLALENARLFADTQRRAEQLATLHRVGLDITAALDLNGLLETLYEQVGRIVDVGTFYIALYEEPTGKIRFPLFTGRDGPIEAEPLDIYGDAGITGHVIKTGEPLYVPDLASPPEDLPVQPVVLSEPSTRSFVGVPLIFREQVFGVLSVQSYQANAYSPEAVELLSTIATQASIAIQNAQAYQRLVETAEQLREVDRLKTQFLANMSHELRTPLNSIIGFSRVMLKGIDGPLTDLQEADLSSIYNSGQHLLGLINSILDMSKIEAGKMDLSFEELQLSEIFDAVLSTTRALVKDQPVELRSEVPEDLPAVWADAQRVRQILINLMSNAAKFTEEGHITLKAAAGPENVKISVIDTGIGIDPEAQSRLFIPFQQVDASTTRRAGGTGLGLAISRRFVEMQGGEIWVESEVGEGSAFSFTLPIYQVVRDAEKGDEDLQLDPDKKTILAVDDDRGVITLLQRYLENDGYQVVGVVESTEAMNMARRLSGRLCAITLDIVMPQLDGWQILESLKRDPRTRDLPVVLCSIVEGLEQGLSMGAAACLRKPVTRDELLETLQTVELEPEKAD